MGMTGESVGKIESTPDWWGEALAEHARWLRTVIFARVGDADSVDEIMQDVAVKALERGDQLRDRSRVAPWLYRIGITSAVEYRRKQGRRKRLAERVADRGVPTHERACDPLGWLLANEMRSHVREAVKRLPPRDAEVLLLKYVEGWSYREIAENLSLSISNVESRLHRARAKLRKILSNMESGNQPVPDK